MASALGVTMAAIGNWKARGVPVQRCVVIERLTQGAVTRRDLRPDDWRDIWPELIESETKQHPALTSDAQTAIKTQAIEEGANA
ncbi:MAG: Cro/CI family transcriptional regulator [Comamonas sp.]